MLTLLIAVRNLLRNRRRSLATLLAMVIGAQAVLIFGGFANDIARGLETGYVQYSGHFQIQRKGYFRYGAGDPPAYSIHDYRSLIERLRRDPVLGPMLSEVTPTLSVSGIAGNFEAGTSKPVAVWGGIANELNAMRQWDDYAFHIANRPFALLGTADDAATVGEGVARVLQLCRPLEVSDCEGPPARTETRGAALPDDVAALADQEVKRKDAGHADAAGATIELLAATVGGVTTGDGRFAYTTNAGSGTIRSLRIAADGPLSLLNADAGTLSAPLDMAFSSRGKFLYVWEGNGAVSGFRVMPAGTLVPLGSVTGVPSGAHGIAAR